MQASQVTVLPIEQPVQACGIQNEIAEYREQNHLVEMPTVKSSKKNKMLSKAKHVTSLAVENAGENQSPDHPLSCLDTAATSKKKSHTKNQKKDASVQFQSPRAIVSESTESKPPFKKNTSSVHTNVLQIVNSELQEMRKMIVDLQKEFRTGSTSVTALGKQPVTNPSLVVAPVNVLNKKTSREHTKTHKRLDIRLDLPVVPCIAQDGVDGLTSQDVVAAKALGVVTQGLVKDTNLGLYCSYDMRMESSPGNAATISSEIDTIQTLLEKIEKCCKSTIFFPTKIHKQKPEVGEMVMAVSKKDEPIIIYAGIIDFPIIASAEQKQLIAHEILTGLTMPLLCSKSPPFLKASEAATALYDHLSAKGLQPLYCCTGEDGFRVSWRDPACFLRCGDGLDVSNRVVQIFLPEYVGENCYEKIKGQCVLARGIQKSLTHAPGTLFQNCLPGYIMSTGQKQLCLFPETADADDSSVMSTQFSPRDYAIEYAAKTRGFWTFVLSHIPQGPDISIRRLPRSTLPKAHFISNDLMEHK
jgi:hypothetical protein